MSRLKKPPESSAKRIDVTSAPPALVQSPFAKLAGIAVAAAAPEPAAATPTPTSTPKSAPSPKPKSAGRLLLRRETKHRGGKAVVLISGFAALANHDARRLGELEKQLKQRLGCGGSLDLERREILIQGDRPEEIAELLRGLGYDVGGVTISPRR